MNVGNVPIPKRMRGLRKDPRGYPIPFNILRDSDGRALFTVNSEEIRIRCLVEDRCAICGNRLTTRRWFVGGPLSAFDPNGWYRDTGMHDECAHYALRVCPYLAAPTYSGRIDLGNVDLSKVKGQTFIDPTMMPHRPGAFVAVESIGQELNSEHYVGLRDLYVRPVKPYTSVEFWSKGSMLAIGEAQGLLPLPELEQLVARVIGKKEYA